MKYALSYVLLFLCICILLTEGFVLYCLFGIFSITFVAFIFMKDEH